MKIAHLLPYSIKFPLPVHNGRYEWVLRLASLQAQNGHDVTVYCHPESVIVGSVINFKGITSASDNTTANNLATMRLALAESHDIYHSHFDTLHYQVASETNTPIVFTQHYQPSDELPAIAQSISAPNVWAVPPTRFMFNLDKELSVQTKTYIHHGIDLDLFQPTMPKGNRLLFVGRIAPIKQVETAIRVAKMSGYGLDIIGKTTRKYSDYWQDISKSIDGQQIKYLGGKSQAELVDYYSEARALLFPSLPNEAFGQAAVEAQACGTPVIAAHGGASNELVEDKKTGYLCDNDDDYVSAIHHISSLSEQDCRHFTTRFDINTMVQKYDDLYKSLIN